MRKTVILLLVFVFVFSPLFSAGLLESPNVILPWNKDLKTIESDLTSSETATTVLLPAQEKDLVISVTPADLQKPSKTNSEGEPVETVPYTDEEKEALINEIAELQEEIRKGEQNFSSIVIESAKDQILIDELQKENDNLQNVFVGIAEERDSLKAENAKFKAKIEDDLFKVRFGANCDYKPLDKFNVGIFSGVRVGNLTADVGIKVDLNDTIANPMNLLDLEAYTLTASVAYEF